MFTLLQATATTDRWGATHYRRLNGLLSAPHCSPPALTPWAGAALAQTLGSYPAVFALLAGLANLAAVLAAGTTRAPRRHRARRCPPRPRHPREGTTTEIS